jgi:hypothetical protein
MTRAQGVVAFPERSGALVIAYQQAPLKQSSDRFGIPTYELRLLDPFSRTDCTERLHVGVIDFDLMIQMGRQGDPHASPAETSTAPQQNA